MDLGVTKVKVGELETNCYIGSLPSGDAFVVDPGDEAARIIGELEKIPSLNLRYILLTHAHYDHVMAAEDLKFKYPRADIVVGMKDEALLRNMQKQEDYAGHALSNITADVLMVSEGSLLPFPVLNIQVLESPGHTPGGVVYFVPGYLFSGDTIFYHTYGRTDLPGGSMPQLAKSLNRLIRLPEATKIYPGHGRETTIGEEKNFWKR